MKKLALSQKIVLSAALLLCINADARDLGRYGSHTYEIQEEDAGQFMQRRVAAKMANGGMETFMREMRTKSENYVRRPPGVHLPRASKPRGYEFDPSLQLQEDIRDGEGNVLYPAGTIVNPLDYKNFTKVMCFFDADDAAQVLWAQRNCSDLTKHLVILTNGDVTEMVKLMKRHVYFDQLAKLREHFELTAVPSTIRQKGRMLLIEEYVVE